MTTSTLPAPSYRDVLVAGVKVELFEDSKPSRMAPMRVSLRFWLEAGEITPEQFTRLHLAGVQWLPLYESEDVKYEEID